METQKEDPKRHLARSLCRGNVVSGPVQLRLPPNRDVRYFLWHPGRRDFILRLQPGVGWRQIIEEHAQDRQPRRLVSGTWAT